MTVGRHSCSENMKEPMLELFADSPLLLVLSGPNKALSIHLLFLPKVSFSDGQVIHRHERVRDISKLTGFCWVFPFLIRAFRGFKVWSEPAGSPGQSGMSPTSRGHSPVWFATQTLAADTSWTFAQPRGGLTDQIDCAPGVGA